MNSRFLLPSAFCLLLTAGAGFAQTGELSIVEKGFDYRIWERTEFIDGNDRPVKSGYTELETGMHYLEGDQWRESEAVIEITPTGAAALKGNHKVHFLANLNAPGAVDLVMRDGQRLTSHILGLSYFDAATGKSVLIAELKDSVGVLTEPNVLVYPDAFTDLKADVRYIYTKAGLEQDVIFREQFLSPAEYGLNPQTTRLQFLTEFDHPPAPRIEKARGGQRETDAVLDFGVMRIGVGKAFLIGKEQGQIAVDKAWVKLQGRDFLIEEIDYPAMQTQLEALPLPPQAMRRPNVNGVRHLVSNERVLPRREVASTEQAKPIQVALGSVPTEGFVLDYLLLSSATNFTFKGDTTFYVSGAVNLSSNTVIEGGTVVKFTNHHAHVSRAINIFGTVDCQTGPYRPAIFTSKDDNTVGENIAGSTGAPSGYYGNGLVIYSSGNTLHDMRFAYLQTGVSGVPITGDLNLAHLQFVFCKYPVFFSPVTCGLGPCNNKLTLDNALIYRCETAFTGENGTWRGQHVTVHDCNTLTYDAGDEAQISLTNSLLVTVTNAGNMPLTLVSTAEHASDSGIFQTVGAGSHYLADPNLRNIGTLGISQELSRALLSKTTFPPTEITANFTGNDSLSPQSIRDADGFPDLGYHYDPLDYVVNAKTISDSLYLSGGVVLGTYGSSTSYGLAPTGNGTLTSEGTATKPNWIVRYNTVQEQSTANWASSSVASSVKILSTSSTAHFLFTGWSNLGGPGNHFQNTTGSSVLFSFVQCEFSSGRFTIDSGAVALTNCLWQRVYVDLRDDENDLEWYLYNNLFYGGTLYYKSLAESPILLAYDNLFDRTTITRGGGSENFTHNYNGYIANQSRLIPNQANDEVLSSMTYASAGSRRWYHGITALVNEGSRSATDADLSNFTVRTDQTADGDAVDIGYHYQVVQAPTASPDEFSWQTCPGIPREIILTGSDPQSLPLTFSIVTAPMHGSLGPITQINETSASVTYTSSGSFCGEDEFTFKVNNGYLDSSSATITIRVGDPNPIAHCQDVMTGKNTPVTFTLSGSDACGGSLTFTVVSGPSPGSVTGGSGASRTYTPSTSTFEGADSFQFIANNCGFSSSSSAQVTVKVVPGPTLTTECLPHSIVLKWTLPSFLEPLAAPGYIKDFQIYRCTTSSGTCTPGTTTPFATIDDIGVLQNPEKWMFIDTAVEPDTVYCYQIRFRHQETGCAPATPPTIFESPLSSLQCNTVCCPDSELGFWTDHGPTKEQLAAWLSEPGDSVSNVHYTGALLARGIFGGGLAVGLPFDSGIILSSGNIHNAKGPNDDEGGVKEAQFNLPGDDALDDLLEILEPETNPETLDTEDAAVLVFDLTPSSTKTIQFQYVFASEEYPEFIEILKNDAIAIFVDDENIAWVPGSTNMLPVCVFTINSMRNSEFFQENLPDPNQVFDLQYDGFTSTSEHLFLTASFTVEEGVPVRIKIVIADEDDDEFDSAIFISAKSPICEQ